MVPVMRAEAGSGCNALDFPRIPHRDRQLHVGLADTAQQIWVTRRDAPLPGFPENVIVREASLRAKVWSGALIERLP
jgi:hypothetical protein